MRSGNSDYVAIGEVPRDIRTVQDWPKVICLISDIYYMKDDRGLNVNNALPEGDRIN